jgi:hypothetical protein
MAKRPYQMTIGEFIKSSLLQVGDPTEFHAQWTLNTEAEKLPKGVSVKSMVQGVIIKVYTVASGAFKGDRMADIKTTPEPPWKGKIAKEVPMDEISYGPKHEALIKEALDAGKPVSSAILKDYPDLEAEIQSKRESILMKPPTLIPEEVFSKVPKQGKARIRYTYDKIMKPIQAEVKRIQKQPDGGAANLEKIQRHYKKIATAFKPYQLPYGEWSARIAAFRVSHFGKAHSQAFYPKNDFPELYEAALRGQKTTKAEMERVKADKGVSGELVKFSNDIHKDMIQYAQEANKRVPDAVLVEQPDLKRAKPAKKAKSLPSGSKELKFNSTEYGCYGKNTKRGYRVYCRRVK